MGLPHLGLDTPERGANLPPISCLELRENRYIAPLDRKKVGRLNSQRHCKVDEDVEGNFLVPALQIRNRRTAHIDAPRELLLRQRDLFAGVTNLSSEVLVEFIHGRILLGKRSVVNYADIKSTSVAIAVVTISHPIARRSARS
jgi:hypothetical protein